MAAVEVVVQFPPDHMAERLRIRKGNAVRLIQDGEVTHYRVVKVSMPDDLGRCTVDVEPV